VRTSPRRSVTLIDDPTDARHFAASPFDAEGLASRGNELIVQADSSSFVYDNGVGPSRRRVSTGKPLSGVSGSPRRDVGPYNWCRATVTRRRSFDGWATACSSIA